MDWFREYEELVNTELSEESYKTFVQKWRRTLHGLVAIKGFLNLGLFNLVQDRRELRALQAKGINVIPNTIEIFNVGDMDEGIFRRLQSRSDSLTNMLRELHDIREFGKLLYHQKFDSNAALEAYEGILTLREQEKEKRKMDRLARVPSPEERLRLRAEKRAKWFSANTAN